MRTLIRRSSTIGLLGITAMLAACGGGGGGVTPEEADAGSPNADRAHPGFASYNQHCKMCHGPSGAGDGGMASMLPNKPRDFKDPWAYLTATDEAAIVNEMVDLLERGIPDKGMNSYKGTMDTEELADVARYVLHLRGAG